MNDFNFEITKSKRGTIFNDPYFGLKLIVKRHYIHIYVQKINMMVSIRKHEDYNTDDIIINYLPLVLKELLRLKDSVYSKHAENILGLIYYDRICNSKLTYLL